MLHRLQGERQVWLQAIGRLEPGVGVEAARANMTTLARRLEVEYAEWNEGRGVALTEHYQYNPNQRGRLVMLARLLMVVVGAVLLIACANIAILLLTRAASRRKELGVRLALGAGRGRLVLQLLTESLVLAVLGGLVGYAIASWLADVAGAMIPVSFSIQFRPDSTVLGFTLMLSAITAVLFGLLPALVASRPDIVEELKGGTQKGGRSPLRSALVVVQVAVSIVLVSGAGLFVRSFQTAQAVDLGFDVENRLLMRVNLRNHGYSSDDGKAFVRQLRDRLATLPGIATSTTAFTVPLDGFVWSGGFNAEGVEPSG